MAVHPTLRFQIISTLSAPGSPSGDLLPSTGHSFVLPGDSPGESASPSESGVPRRVIRGLADANMPSGDAGRLEGREADAGSAASATGESRGGTLGRMTMKSTRSVLGHSLLSLPVRSHRSLFRLLRTARFTRVLRSAPIIRSLTRSLTQFGAHGKAIYV